MRRLLWLALGSMMALSLLVTAAPARVQAADNFPDVINLPNGWLPEGITTGRGGILYSGSRANGAIYAADLRTGEGSILYAGATGRVAVGLNYDERTNYIFVAGGPSGKAYVHDAATGDVVAEYTLTTATPAFINDVIITRDAAYFTNSNRAEIYRLPLGAGGSLPTQADVQTIPLSGDFRQVPGFNANGIEASANGKSLVIVHSTLGVLYNVDPATGVAKLIDLGGASVTNGDGIRFVGNTLYVVRNRLNQIAVFKVSSDLSSATLTETITNPNFDVPTTLAKFGSSLYAVNARFTTPPTPNTTYNVIRFDR